MRSPQAPGDRSSRSSLRRRATLGPQSQQARGSGLVDDTTGHLTTNAQVVSGATSVRVLFPDGSTYAAKVVGADAGSGLAVISIRAPPAQLHPLVLRDSLRVRVGEKVVAVGSPFGLQTTVTSGIVSALDREVAHPTTRRSKPRSRRTPPSTTATRADRCSAPHGRMIGVNSEIESDSGGNDGVGFAVASNTMASIASQLAGGAGGRPRPRRHDYRPSSALIAAISASSAATRSSSGSRASTGLAASAGAVSSTSPPRSCA